MVRLLVRLGARGGMGSKAAAAAQADERGLGRSVGVRSEEAHHRLGVPIRKRRAEVLQDREQLSLGGGVGFHGDGAGAILSDGMVPVVDDFCSSDPLRWQE